MWIIDGGEVFLGLPQVGVGLFADLRDEDENISNQTWQWQHSATETGAYTDIPVAEGGTSNPYIPSVGDLGKWLKVKVTYDDEDSTGHTTQATAYRPVLSQPTLSNASRGSFNFIGYVNNHPVLHRYAQKFMTGPHTRGYRLTAVRLALNLHGDSAAGTWGVHADDAGKPAATPLSAAQPILNSDLDSAIDTFEEFTHPEGVLLQPNARYWIVISQTTPVKDGNISIITFDEKFQENLVPVEVTGGDYMCTRPVASDSMEDEEEEEEFPCRPPADPGSESGWSFEFDALAHYYDDPNAPNAPDVPDEPEDPEEAAAAAAAAAADAALLPWDHLGDVMQLPRRVVLNMSLVAPPVVTVKFGASDYTVDEGNSVSVEVELSSDPKSTITIPITTMGEGGATSADYSVPTSPSPSTGARRPRPSPSRPPRTRWMTTGRA